MPYRHLRFGLLCAGLILTLSGCAAAPTPIPVHQAQIDVDTAQTDPAETDPALGRPLHPVLSVDVTPPGAFDFPVGDTLKVRVMAAQGSMPTVKRQVTLMRNEQGDWNPAGSVTLPHLPGGGVRLWRDDLPGYRGALIIESSRGNGVRHGAVALVDGTIVALDYHRLAAPVPEIFTGVYLYLNKYMNQLWVFQDGGLVATFPTANGRDPWGVQPTWANLKTNYNTPEGLFSIKSKIVNPPYHGLSGTHPPADGGAANNPLGTRWIGFEGLPGDGGSIWGMHGTYLPDQIGTWASEGCVRLNTADSERLFELVPVGAMIRIVSGR